jgi:hypothetical protein
MTTDVSTHQRLERYLREVRTALRTLPTAQADEIIEELRSHVRDSVAAGAGERERDHLVAEALARLGTPEEIAALYVAQTAPQPTAVRWRALADRLWLLPVLAGYTLTGALLLTALTKLMAPDQSGLWVTGDGDWTWAAIADSTSPPPPGRQLLGGWFAPIGLMAAAVVGSLTELLRRRTSGSRPARRRR